MDAYSKCSHYNYSLPLSSSSSLSLLFFFLQLHFRTLTLLSLHPFRQRQIRWRLTHREPVSQNRPLTSNWQPVRRWGWDIKGEQCSFPCSLSAGVALQMQQALRPLSRWSQTLAGPNAVASRNPCRPQSPAHPAPRSRLFILSWPGVSWGYLTQALRVKIFFSL